MRDPEASRARAMREAWEADELRQFLARQPEARERHRTGSGLPLERVYTPEHVADTPFEEIGLPGQYPFTRGPYPTMYRGRLWTMRQIAGFGTGEDTNGRFRYLIAQGQTGLSVDFDMPTLMGYDSDDPKSIGEVGREGVAIDTLDDMEALFADIDLEKISVSMTINPSAWILLSMYVALAQSRGFDRFWVIEFDPGGSGAFDIRQSAVEPDKCRHGEAELATRPVRQGILIRRRY